MRPTEKRQAVFEEIAADNIWKGDESLSGPGSDLGNTRVIARDLPGFLQRYQVSSVLDLPCGDYNWMRHVDLSGIDYRGADIVPALVEANQEQHASDRVGFLRLDLCADDLPFADLVLVRDCLVHLTVADIFAALGNLKRSGSTYLLTTTFPTIKRNLDIKTGFWRPLNLEIAPFNFPEPIDLLVEECRENDGQFADKSLGLWRIADIPEDG